MAIVKCYECSAEVSDRAVACPVCGAPKPGVKPDPDAPTTKYAVDAGVRVSSIDATWKNLVGLTFKLFFAAIPLAIVLLLLLGLVILIRSAP